jgi:hypothetical protein
MSSEKPLSSFWRYPAAAAFLNISPSTLRRKVMLKEVPHVKPFGGKHSRVLFDPEDLRALIERGKVPVA